MIKDTLIRRWFQANRDQAEKEIIKIFDVEYAHLKLENNDDLYVTKYGLPFIEQLRPENFLTDKEWFSKNSLRLSGTSCLYKVRTKKINGICKDIVLKWNRMGQIVPGVYDTKMLMDAEFNSPFEEFSLVMELKEAINGSPERVLIQRPLAIFAPSESRELWQTGRIEHKMKSKIESHKEVELNMFRSYAVIYEWIEGIDATDASRKGILHESHLELLTLDSEKNLIEKGFVVRDSKPHHIIIKPNPQGGVARDRKGNIIYGLVDFELLERTPDREEMIKKVKRLNYLKRQRDRFKTGLSGSFHPHLRHMNIFGVDYIYGNVQSTGGKLWVVGKDPYLFDYFLPERWKYTPKTKISIFNEMYYTVTKDNIHLVYKVSRVGLQPDMDPYKEDERRLLEYGYNSPFEEVSIAIELSHKGIATIYPRAIYMTGNRTEISENLLDNSRYESHKNLKTPEGTAILRKDRDYILIWGYWNGPDEKLADKDGDYYEGIDALRSYREGIITRDEYFKLLQSAKERLSKAGFEDLNLRGNHILISLDSRGRVVVDKQGLPEIRINNFEFIRKTG
jgi:hypothetical protein